MMKSHMSKCLFVLVLSLVVKTAWAIWVIRGQHSYPAAAPLLASTILAGPNDARNLLEERLLQTVPIPATRECGQVIGVTSKEVILSLLDGLVGVLFPDGGGDLAGSFVDGLASSFVYDIQASVMCSSCEEVATEELLSDTDANGFASYCGEDRYGYNVTHSGLLFLPLDQDTSELLADVKLKVSSMVCNI